MPGVLLCGACCTCVASHLLTPARASFFFFNLSFWFGMARVCMLRCAKESRFLRRFPLLPQRDMGFNFVFRLSTCAWSVPVVVQQGDGFFLEEAGPSATRDRESKGKGKKKKKKSKRAEAPDGAAAAAAAEMAGGGSDVSQRRPCFSPWLYFSFVWFSVLCGGHAVRRT